MLAMSGLAAHPPRPDGDLSAGGSLARSRMSLGTPRPLWRPTICEEEV